MYNNSYEEYIRSILGYPNNGEEDYYQNNEYNNEYTNYNMPENYTENRTAELEQCYPEIYKVVYPMVRKACQNVTGPITEEKIDQMVDELYINIEGNNEITINNTTESINNVQVENRINDMKTTKPKTIQETRTFNGKRVVAEPVRVPKKDTMERNIVKEEKRETRYLKPKNCAMCDLIKILLLRELIDKPGRPPYRPGWPNRPPLPPQGRPPYRPF